MRFIYLICFFRFQTWFVLLMCGLFARIQTIVVSRENIAKFFHPGETIMQLADKNITEVDDNAFAVLADFQRIIMSRNNISEITESMFKKNKKLLVIFIDYNLIQKIHKNAFTATTELEELHLNNNDIVSIPESLLKNNRKLLALNLDNNKISKIDPLTFLNLPLLRELHIKNNNITQFNSRALENSNKLEKLYFSNNQISSLDFKNFKRYFPNLSEIGINDNNFTCPNVRYMIEEFRPQGIIIEDLMQGPGEQSGINCQYNNQFTATIFGREIEILQQMEAENQEKTLAQEKLNADLIKHLKVASESNSPGSDRIVSEILSVLLELRTKN